MELKIKKLQMTNFKGMKSQEVIFDEGINFIRGANASGKTTISDAIHWLLFDKDSQGRKDFEIRPLDTDNNEIHFIDIEVEADFTWNDTTLNLRKKQVENWVKPRGKSEQEYAGNTTSYFINEVPVKAGEYGEKIREISSNENLFRLVTNPGYFNNGIKWEERRKMLLDLVTNTDDQALIASNVSFKGLEEAVKKWTIDEFKTVIAARIKDLKKEIENIPGRIDELTKSLSEAGTDYEQIEDEIANYRAREKELDAILSSGSAAMEQWKKDRAKIDEVDNQIRETVKNLDGLESKTQSARGFEMQELEIALRDLIYKQNTLKKDIERLETSKVSELEFKHNLQNEFRNISMVPVTKPVLEGNCPTCGQLMPAEAMKEQTDLLFEKANAEKKKKLDGINNNGKTVSKNIETMEVEIVKLNKGLEDLVLLTKIAEEKKDNYNVGEVDVVAKDKLEKELSVLKTRYQMFTNALVTPGEENIEVREEKVAISLEISELSKVLGKKEYFETTEKRIQELTKEEQRYQNELSHAEGQKQLIEDFIRFKVSLLEESINKHFTIVKFKLFKDQINKGLKEICEAVVDGVPYSELNTGNKLNAGLDIINTFSKIFRFTAMMIIDNRESVTEIIPMDTQVINLMVDPECKSLTIN